jgi:formylglycine-generating enzyme required for sulfatase activity
MATLKQLLQRTHQNLLILKEREAKHGSNVPLELLNQISDHEAAIKLIKQSLSIELTETGLNALKEDLRPLLVASNVEQIDLDEVKLDLPRLPYEPEIVLIPAGPFLMGSDEGEVYEAPQHEVNLPAYQIGQYPVTNAQYAEFIKRETKQAVPSRAWLQRQPPAGQGNYPVVAVTWHDALAYCRWLSEQTGRHYRLPTEAEWEKAARGTDGRRYPWGNEWTAGYTKADSHDITPVTIQSAGEVEQPYQPQGASPYGCYNMVGNVQEWTSTLWGSSRQETTAPYPYQANDGREDLAADKHLPRLYRVYRGGMAPDEETPLRCSTRNRARPQNATKERGFRVVLDV